MLFRNPFDQKQDKPSDKKTRDQILGESVERYNQAIQHARACLDRPEFKKYKQECETAIVELFESWLNLPVDENYAMRSIILSERIKALRSLGVAVVGVANLTPRTVKPTQEIKTDAK